jgi:hypothetical protein
VRARRRRSADRRRFTGARGTRAGSLAGLLEHAEERAGRNLGLGADTIEGAVVGADPREDLDLLADLERKLGSRRLVERSAGRSLGRDPGVGHESGPGRLPVASRGGPGCLGDARVESLHLRKEPIVGRSGQEELLGRDAKAVEGPAGGGSSDGPDAHRDEEGRRD